MADLARPDYGTPWASEGEIVAPVQNKMELGWVQEMMPFQWENYLQNRQDGALLYLLQKGIPEYSATQEYIAQKSAVLYMGDIYVATQTGTGVLPTVAASWKRLSASTDASGAVTISGGGTGATTAEGARTNLGLGTASLLSADVVVQKDGNGNFSAGTITASLAGNATSSDKWKTARTINITGAATSDIKSMDGTVNTTLTVSTLDATKLTGVATVNTTGNSATATKLESARALSISGGVTAAAKNFDGSIPVDLVVTAIDVSKANAGTLSVVRGGTGTTTATGTGKLVLDNSPALTGTPTAPTAAVSTNNTQVANTAFVQAVNASDTGSAATAVKLKTARAIGGVSFDGSADITLPGVNSVGTQNTTGSAATLTTARTINGTAFNGSVNITTANWGTARNITVGSSTKSVNGSANVSWTLPEIGAEPVLTSGTTSQYLRGDKTWQALNKASVGLGNVDNTSDANKPISTPTAAALANKVDKVSGSRLITSEEVAKLASIDPSQSASGSLFEFGIHNGPRSTIPVGFYAYDGQVIQKSVAPDLCAAIWAGAQHAVDEAQWATNKNKWSRGDGSTWVRAPNLNMADGSEKPFYLRGGPESVNGSWVGDAQRDFTAVLQSVGSAAGANFSEDAVVSGAARVVPRGVGAKLPSTSASNSPAGNVEIGPSIAGLPTADENRVKTANIVYIFRAFGDVANAGAIDAAALATQLAGVDAAQQAMAARVANNKVSLEALWSGSVAAGPEVEVTLSRALTEGELVLVAGRYGSLLGTYIEAPPVVVSFESQKAGLAMYTASGYLEVSRSTPNKAKLCTSAGFITNVYAVKGAA